MANEKTIQQQPVLGEPAYKFVKSTYDKIGVYLQSRPYNESTGLYISFFEHNLQDPFYKAEAVNQLMNYLMSCPMKEVRFLIDEIQNGGLQKFVPTAQSDVAESAATEVLKSAPEAKNAAEVAQ